MESFLASQSLSHQLWNNSTRYSTQEIRKKKVEIKSGIRFPIVSIISCNILELLYFLFSPERNHSRNRWGWYLNLCELSFDGLDIFFRAVLNVVFFLVFIIRIQLIMSWVPVWVKIRTMLVIIPFLLSMMVFSPMLNWIIIWKFLTKKNLRHSHLTTSCCHLFCWRFYEEVVSVHTCVSSFYREFHFAAGSSNSQQHIPTMPQRRKLRFDMFF